MQRDSGIAQRIAARFVPALMRTVNCSDCGRAKAEVAHMVAGPNVYICDCCIDQAAQQLAPRIPAPDAPRCRFCRQLFGREPVRRFPVELHRVMLRKLVAVDAAEALDDLRVPPGNRLEKLKKDRVGQHSIRVNDQWRVCFRWRDGDAFEVELVDYH